MSDVLHQSVGELQAKADELGLVLFIAQSDELMIDRDSRKNFTETDVKIIGYLKRHDILIKGLMATVSKGDNQHIYFKLSKDLTNTQRICIQACLGSDPEREALSLIQELSQLDAPTALFETQSQAEKVNKWRARPYQEYLW